MTLAELAGVIGLSRSHFCRAFRQSFGISPRAYHDNLRVSRAKSLLVETELSVEDIAVAVGARATHFASFFKRHAGTTPSRYRRQAEESR